MPSGDVAMVLSKPCPNAPTARARLFCMAPDVAAEASVAGAAEGGTAGKAGALGVEPPNNPPIQSPAQFCRRMILI